jgi:hypothetical protein
MRAVDAIRRSSPERPVTYSSVAGCPIFAEATVRCAHHSPDGSESRSAEATCGSFLLPDFAAKKHVPPEHLVKNPKAPRRREH